MQNIKMWTKKRDFVTKTWPQSVFGGSLHIL